MRMNWKSLSYLFIGIACIILLLFLYSAADPISAQNVGFSYQVEQAIKSLIIILLAWVITRFVSIFCWDPMETKRGKPVSRIVKDAVMIIVYAIAAIFILAVIYGKDATAIWASLATVGAPLALASVDFIKDCIAGIILDFTGNFKTGDWIKLPNGVNAKVHNVKLRETEFKLINETSIVLSNSKLLNYDIVNYNDSEEGYWGDVSVTLDRSIPVDRAKRLLQAAAASAPEVFKKQAKVVAKEVSNGCVVYKVLYKIPNFSLRSVVLHNVIQAIMKHLQDHNLNIAETTSRVYQGDDSLDVLNKIHQTSPFDTLQLSPLFTECSPDDIKKIAQVLKMKLYKPGEIIIAEKSTGSTMYFIAEGIVEISIQVLDETQEETSISVKKHITYLATNDFFGEGGVLHNSPRNATVSAHTDVIAYELSKDDLKHILQELPDVTLKISEAMIMRRQETSDIAHKVKLSLQEKKKLTSDFANALKNFLGLS